MPQNFTNAVRNARRRTVNDILKKARTQSSKELRQVYNIKAADLKVYLHTRMATNSLPVGYLRVANERIPMDRFDPRPRIVKTARGRRIGVSVRIRKASGRRLVKGGFLGRMAKGRRKTHEQKLRHQSNKTVFTRVGKERHPIARRRTVTSAKMFRKHVEQKFLDLVSKEMPRIYDSNLQFYLRGRQ